MFAASIRNNGGFKFHAAMKDYAFDISTEGQGAHPIDTVLAGLCGCMGHFTRDYLSAEAITGGELSVNAEADLLEDGPRLSAIRVTITIRNITLEESQKKGLLKFIRQCPVYNTLKANAEVNFTLRT